MDLVYLFARWPEWARSWIINTKQKKKRRKNLATKDLKRISITLWQPYKASFIFVIQQVNLTISISNSNSNKAESGRSIFAVGDCQYQRYSSEKVKLL